MRRIFLTICIWMALTLALLSPSGLAFDDYNQEEISMYAGETKTLSINSPKRIVIGKPNIADVSEVTKNELTLSAKSAGKTNLVVSDSLGERLYVVRVFSEDMQDIKRRVDNLLEKLELVNVYTTAEDEEGRVLLLGSVEYPSEREKIASALGELKSKTVDLIEVGAVDTVVEIDVQVLELNRDATSTLGFSWPANLNIVERGTAAISASGTEWGSLFNVSRIARDAFTLKLDTLIQEGKARILSRPRLSCQSGKEAELLVGGEAPIFTTEVVSGGGAGTSIEYKEFGIRLNIRPVVTAENRVNLALNVEVSDIGEADIIGPANAPTAKAFPLNKRTVSTEVTVNDGQTLSIGGLIKEKTEEDLRKFPWLSEIPVLGLFFRQKTVRIGGGQGERGDTELFIALTPTVVSKKQKSAWLAKDQVSMLDGAIPGSASKATQEVQPSLTIEKTDPLFIYASAVQKRILERIIYPDNAKNAGFSGTVKLALHLSYNGQLLEAQVKASSGFSELDNNAVSAAKSISLYPPFPSSVTKQEVWVDVPIVYSLK